MKKIISNLIILFFFLGTFPLMAVERADIDFTPVPIAQKSSPLKLEVGVTNFSQHFIREVRLYYRPIGESRFRFTRMGQEGLKYIARVNVAGIDGALIEYYFDFEYEDGAHQTYPEDPVNKGMLTTALRQETAEGDFILVISPEPDEEIFTDEIVLTVSFPQLAGRVDAERTRVYIDTWDVSRYVNNYDDFLSFAPRQVPSGSHTVRVELFDQTGKLLASKSWQFRARKRQGPRVATGGIALSGQFYAQTRQENLRDSDQKTNYSDGGFSLNGSGTNLSFGARLYVSNQEKSDRQPINRYSGYFQWDFWNNRHLRLSAGDVYPELNPFLLKNIFLRGGYGQLFLKFLNLDIAAGRSMRAIEGSQQVIIDNQTGNPVDTVSTPGTFQQDIFAIRPSFGSRQNFQLGFLYLKGKDDPKSIKLGADPKENVGLGSDIFLALDRQRFIIEGSVNASAYNRNITGGTIPFDTLNARLEGDLDESDRKLYDLAKKFITVNENLILKPGIAYEGQVRLRYFKNSFVFRYEYVEEDFFSLGQPYLLRDNKGFSISDNIFLMNNQLFLSLGYRKYANNLLDTKATTTDNKTLYFNISYFPARNLPSFTFGYNNYSRLNDLTPDQVALGIPEDNETNSTNFSTSYSFVTGAMNHRAMVTLANYRRTDNNFDTGDNNANTLTIVLQTRYSVPLRTNLEVMLQQSESAVGSAFESNLTLNSFGLGAQYNFSRLFESNDNLMVGVGSRFGNVSTASKSTNSSFDYNRTFLNGRIIYAHPSIGRLSLNGDMVLYAGDRDYRDVILTARYDLNF